MSTEQGINTLIVNSIIGQGTVFRGDIDAADFIRIDGDFVGNIKSSGKVLIGQNGRVKSQIHAQSVIVGGIIKGEIHAQDNVVVRSSGVVIGNISAKRIQIEENALLEGQCKISGVQETAVKNPVKKKTLLSGWLR